MFDKIFGIFRKRKKTDISEEIPGDVGEEMFDIGDVDMGDDFDADTISLETGMSDGGFSSTPGSGEDIGSDFGDSIGLSDSAMDEEMGLDLEGEELASVPPMEGPPISPPPEVEAFAPRKRKRALTGLLLIVVVAVVGLAAGFFAIKPGIELAKGLLSGGPTPQEQLTQLNTEITEIETQLTVYNEVGSIDKILEIKNELERRNQIVTEIDAVEEKIANQEDVEERVGRLTERLTQVQHDVLIQKGALANVQKAVKQIEARNNYLMTTTRERLDNMKQIQAESEVLKSRLEADRIEKAESASMVTHEIREGVERTALEALSSS